MSHTERKNKTKQKKNCIHSETHVRIPMCFAHQCVSILVGNYLKQVRWLLEPQTTVSMISSVWGT